MRTGIPFSFVLLGLACSGHAPPPPPAPAAEPAPAPVARTEPAPMPTPEPEPEPEQTVTAPDLHPQPAGRVYVACGCGCCGGGAVSPGEGQCVGSEAELQRIIDADRQASQNPQCAVMGCSLGQAYRVCD